MKRHASPSTSVPAAAAPRAVKPADPAPPTVSSPSLGSLPTDLLAEIFAHTPFRARMVTLSLVCKRFRSAALRSLDSVVLPATRGTAPLLGHTTATALLALVPSVNLKSLSAENTPITTFPTDALESLSLGLWPLETACEMEQLGVRTFLSAHFPHLRSLKITLTVHPEVDRIAGFLARHATQLTRLHIVDRPGDSLALQAAVAALTWPALQDLTMECTAPQLEFGRFVAAMQTSAALRLTSPASVFNVIPTAQLANLVHWHNVDELDSDVDVARLKSLPRLRSIACMACELPGLQAKITAWWIHESPAEITELAKLTNLETLHWEMKMPYKEPLTVPPKLTTLTVGNQNFWDMKDAEWGVRLACMFLRTQPALRNITIYLETRDPTAATPAPDEDDLGFSDVLTALLELADLAYKANAVITLIGDDAAGLAEAVPQARLGWLTVHAIDELTE